MQINVSSNHKKLSRSLDHLGRKQLPFAFAKTLNQALASANNAADHNMTRRRPKWLLSQPLSGVAIAVASKFDVTTQVI